MVFCIFHAFLNSPAPLVPTVFPQIHIQQRGGACFPNPSLPPLDSARASPPQSNFWVALGAFLWGHRESGSSKSLELAVAVIYDMHGGATPRLWTPTTSPTNCWPEAWGGGIGGGVQGFDLI